MFRLYYETLTVKGWTNREANFTAGEEATAKAFAQELKAKEGVRGVALHDYRLGKTRKRVPVLEAFDEDRPLDYQARQLRTVLVSQPACEVVNLDAPLRKATRRKAAVAVASEVVVGPEVFGPAKPPRVSKRQRQFAGSTVRE